MRRLLSVLSVFVLTNAIPPMTECQQKTNVTLQLLADSLYAKRLYEEAAGAYERLLKIDDTNGENWYRLGRSSLHVSNFEKAIETFKRAAELDHRKTSSLYNIACSYSRSNRVDDALEWINRAIEAGFGNKYLLLVDTDLDILRGEPEWQHIISSYFKTSEFPDLSQPVLKIRNRGVINVPMRDGVPLATEVLEPEGEVRWRRRSKMECSI